MRTLFIFFITGYQSVISPLKNQFLGVRSTCLYDVSCSTYAKQVISEEGLYVGIPKIARRLMRCSRFTHTYDKSI